MIERIIMTMQEKWANHRTISIGVFFAMLFFCTPHSLFAYFPVTIAPAVIDGEAKAREILRYKVTITNDTKQLVTLYPWARDIDQLGEDTKTQGLDPTTSLLSWLQFSRAELVIPAGESVEFPILVQVNLRARPGNYHAVFRVSDGPNREEAERDKEKTSSIDINVRVEDDANENLQLGLFSTQKNLFVGDEATFGYRLDNTGNRGLVPTGKIRIFDRKGEEVDVIDVNGARDKIEPDSKRQLASVWQSGEHFGKYKAMLDVSYGKTGTIQDTVFFWVLPWKKLLSFFLTLAIVCTIIALLIHSYLASGGRKLAVVEERFFNDDRENNKDGDEEVPVLRDGLYSHIIKKLRESNSFQKLSKKTEYIDALTEIPPPPPRRTRYMTTHSSETERVHLSPRTKAAPIDPAHVVHLKR